MRKLRNREVKCVLGRLSRVWLFETPWTAARQAPLSVGILQAGILEWVAMPSSRESSQPKDRTHVSRVAGGFLTVWATREGPKLKKPDTKTFMHLNLFYIKLKKDKIKLWGWTSLEWLPLRVMTEMNAQRELLCLPVMFCILILSSVTSLVMSSYITVFTL